MQHLFVLAVLLVGCPPPVLEDADVGTDAEVRVPEVPVVGVALLDLDLDIQGCVADEVMVDVENMTVAVEAGTCLTDMEGRALTGAVTVTVSPDASQPPWAGTDDLAFGLRVDVDLGSPDLPVDVLFEPPLVAVAELDNLLASGAWARTWWSEGVPIEAGMLDRPPGLAETIPMERSGVHALTYGVQQSADEVTERRLTCANPITHTIDIGPASDPFPRPMSILIVNPRTSEIVGALVKAGGLQDGESTQHINGRTGDADFEARARAVGDRRFLEITTCYSNRFTIRYSLAHDPDALIDSITQETTEVSPTDGPEDANGQFIGAIEVELYGWDPHGYKQLRAMRQAFDLWHAETYPLEPFGTPDLNTRLFFTNVDSDQWYAKLTLNYFDQRVQNFPVERIFGDAVVEYDDRRIIVRLPCPLPWVAATTPAGLRQLNPSDLSAFGAPIGDGSVGERPQFVNPTVVVTESNNGVAISETEQAQTQRLPIPGQTGVAVVDPIDDVFWLTTEADVFAVDVRTTVPERGVAWSAFDVSDAVMRRDGAMMWFVGIDQGSPTFASWDVLRSRVAQVTTEAVGTAWDCVDISPLGDTLWLSNLDNEVVKAFDARDHAQGVTHSVSGMQACPVFDRSGEYALVPTQDGGVDNITVLSVSSGDIDVINTQGRAIVASSAPAALGVDFVFAAPGDDVLGTLVRSAGEWEAAVVDLELPGVSGIAAH